MSAIMVLGTTRDVGVVDDARPMVWVEGVPTDRLRVTRVSRAGRLDEVTVELAGDAADCIGARVKVSWLRRLVDGAGVEEVVVEGRLQRVEQATTGAGVSLGYRVVSAWTDALEGLLVEGWPADSGTVMEAVTSFLGGTGYTLQPAQVRDAGRLNQAAAVRAGTLRRTALERLLADCGCWLRVSGRSVVLTDVGQRHGVLPERVVTHETREMDAVGARRWRAVGDRPRVEGTFELRADWDSALEGQSNETYGRSTSSDFSLYRNVFRRWSLNEDGRLGGDPFDLAALFEQPGLKAAALAFEDCLTLDAGGQRLPAVVEVSDNGGVSWSVYGSEVELAPDHAGVWLAEDLLPSGFLAAAKLGEARLRVTATLVSPQKIESARWRGNPFAGAGQEVVLEEQSVFGWDRVQRGSRHAAGIAAGALQALERDDRVALFTWLVQRMAARSGASLRWAGAFTEVRPGDSVRLTDGALAEVEAMDCRWGDGVGVETRLKVSDTEGVA